MAGNAFCRIDGVLAEEANQAVIFRRGPSIVCQMLLWDLNTDLVTPGQWMRARVYPKRCDVSQDGRYLVLAATKYGTSFPEDSDRFRRSGWTAVSRPPYFTALCLWFTGGAWGGGGFWRTNYALTINRSTVLWEEHIPPSSMLSIKLLSLPPPEHEPLFTRRLLRRGWKGRCGSTFGSLTKRFQSGYLKYEWEGIRERWSAVDLDGKERLVLEPKEWHPQWLDVDRRGRLIYGHEGCLWAWDQFPNGKAEMIADLNGNKFEGIAPPDWATQW
jgi:hypothetical protein